METDRRRKTDSVSAGGQSDTITDRGADKVVVEKSKKREGEKHKADRQKNLR